MADIKMALGLDSRQFDSGMRRATQSLGGFAAKLGLTVGAVASFNKAISAGRTIEDLRIRLNAMTGSAQGGAKALNMAREAATKLPFDLEEIANGMASIIPISDTFKEVETNIQAVADVAALAGLDFETSAMQFQRAFAGGAGAADLFRDRGILAMAGFERGVTYSVEQTQKKLMEFAKANEGVSNELNKTLGGALSQLKDKIFNLGAAFASTFNPAVTGAINEIIKGFDEGAEGAYEFAASLGESLFNAISGIILGIGSLLDTIMPLFDFMSQGVNNLIGFFNKLPAEFKALGLLGFMMLGGKGKLIVVAISAAFDTIVQIASSVLQTIEDVANKALMGINKVIEFVNTIPGVEFELFNKVDFGELSPENIKSKLDEILNMFTDDTQIAMMGPLESRIKQIIDAARKQLEEAKKQLGGDKEPSEDDPIGGEKEGKTSWQRFTEGWANATENFKKTVADATQFGENLFKTMSESFSDSILNFVETGKLSFRDLFKTLMMEIIKMQANKLFLALFDPAGGIFGDLFAGFFAQGGSIPAGKFGIAGEAGPEIIRGPASVTSTNDTAEMLGRSTNITYNIQAVDAPSFQALIARDPEFIYNVTRAGARRIPGGAI